MNYVMAEELGVTIARDLETISDVHTSCSQHVLRSTFDHDVTPRHFSSECDVRAYELPQVLSSTRKFDENPSRWRRVQPTLACEGL